MSRLLRKTVVITGASRGVGRSLAFACAARGANVALLARSQTTPSHPTLTGSTDRVKEELEQAGANALSIGVDVRKPDEIKQAFHRIAETFSSVDVLINNASAIDVSFLPQPSKVALMMDVNIQGTLNTIIQAYPYLRNSQMGQVLSVSPPLSSLHPDWFYTHPAYSTSKYGMTMATLGFSKSLCANTLWPKKLLKTAATKMLEETTGQPYYSRSLQPEVFAERAVMLLERQTTGVSCLDDDILPILNGDDALDDIFV